MATVYTTTFQLRRGNASVWEKNNPVLSRGEPGFEIDTNRLKIGDGSTAWNDLRYIGEEEVVNTATHYDFPSIGRANTIYKAETEQKSYQWNTTKMKYELLSDGASAIDIEIIHGGNANGTT